MERLVALLDDPAAFADLGQRLRAEARAWYEAERTTLQPGTGRALAFLARATLFLVLPLFFAARLPGGAWWLLAVPCAGLGALGAYGLFAAFHDCVHGVFLRSRRANRMLGEVLAALLLLDFEAFRKSHIEHHRLSQSAEDPKRLGLPPDRLEPPPDGEEYLYFGPLSAYPPLLGASVRMSGALLDRPPLLRLLFYGTQVSMVVPLYLLLNASEFSMARRDWRRWSTWRAALLSAALYGGLALLHPAWAGLLLATSLFSYAFAFMVFLTHLGPEQLYFPRRILDPVTASLNVSDVHAGPLARLAGGGFSEHHATHHLFPSVPVYRLARPARWFAERFGEYRPQPLDLMARGTLLRVLDALAAGGARTEHVGFRRIYTASGEAFQRIGRGA